MSNDTKFQMARNVKWHKMSNDTKCQMTQNVKWHKISNGTKCQMTRNFKWHEMTHDTWHMTHDKWQIRHDKWHMKLNFKLHITHMTHDTWHMTHEVWCMMHDTWRIMINDSRQKHPASHTSERTFVPRTVIFSFLPHIHFFLGGLETKYLFLEIYFFIKLLHRSISNVRHLYSIQP